MCSRKNASKCFFTFYNEIFSRFATYYGKCLNNAPVREVLNCVSLKLSSHHPPKMISDEDRLHDPEQSFGARRPCADVPSKGKEVGGRREGNALSLFAFRKPRSLLSIYRLCQFNVRIMDQCQATFWLLAPRHFGESEKCVTGATGQ